MLRRVEPSFVLFAICVAVYSSSHYGGVRSPDGEVYYLTAEALAQRGSFAIEGDVDRWAGFGLAPGLDGRRYSIFGPAFPLAAAPLVLAAELAQVPSWAEESGHAFPPSFYAANGLASVLGAAPARSQGPWAIRWVASFSNVLITAVCVCLFYATLRALGLRETSAYLAAALFGLGTLAWPYAGMFLSEPLATLTALASFFFLVRASKGKDGATCSPSRRDALCAGLCLGVSVAAHITSLLFAPFFLALAWRRPLRRGGLGAPVGFALGLGAVLALLGYHHFARFGDILETGRTVDEALRLQYAYGDFVAPWSGLVGLVMSPGKGLLLYCPAALLGLLAWPSFHRSHRRLSLVLAGLVAFRLIFLAFRSDWHGGFCLGPRYLVPVLPYLLIPCAVWLDASRRTGGRRFAAVGVLPGVLCVAQQVYFSLGEVCSFFHVENLVLRESPGRVVHDWGIYFEWDFAPLFRIWRVRRGPFLLQGVDLADGTLFALGLALVLALIAVGAWCSRAAERSRPRAEGA